jgi:hypothetical protein
MSSISFDVDQRRRCDPVVGIMSRAFPAKDAVCFLDEDLGHQDFLVAFF